MLTIIVLLVTTPPRRRRVHLKASTCKKWEGQGKKIQLKTYLQTLIKKRIWYRQLQQKCVSSKTTKWMSNDRVEVFENPKHLAHIAMALKRRKSAVRESIDQTYM